MRYSIRIKLNQEVALTLLDFVKTKTKLYKKLPDPKADASFKNKWFERITKMISEEKRV